jgi:hypothetical protein
MWSFSLAGSMRSRTALIGRAVGTGVGVGDRIGDAVGVGVGLAVLTDTVGDVAVWDDPAPPQDERTIARTTARRPTTSVYRGGRLGECADPVSEQSSGFARETRSGLPVFRSPGMNPVSLKPGTS